MFVQVIEGRTNDPEALHRQLEIWQRDLMPGAIGYLGSTGGCTSDGDCILVARFETAAAARKNSERPEQGAWWAETEKCFSGPVTFHDTSDVDVMMHRPMNDAQFVQVMEGHVTDRARAMELEREADPLLATIRPDLLGTITAYFDDREFASVAYFRSEAEARQAERQALSDEMMASMAEWDRVMKVERYLDIADPWLVKA